jgi:hypothetical protein
MTSWKIVKDKKPEPTKVRRDTLYHGTGSHHLASIKRHGLIPAGRAGLGATASRSWKISGGSASDMIGLVGLTDRTRSAAFYATTVSIGKGKRPIIIEVNRNRLNSKLLVRRKGSSVGGGKEWDYPRRVPPSAIRGYWVYMKVRGKRKAWIYKKKVK